MPMEFRGDDLVALAGQVEAYVPCDTTHLLLLLKGLNVTRDAVDAPLCFGFTLGSELLALTLKIHPLKGHVEALMRRNAASSINRASDCVKRENAAVFPRQLREIGHPASRYYASPFSTALAVNPVAFGAVVHIIFPPRLRENRTGDCAPDEKKRARFGESAIMKASLMAARPRQNLLSSHAEKPSAPRISAISRAGEVGERSTCPATWSIF
jgi:hypothetical protein